MKKYFILTLFFSIILSSLVGGFVAYKVTTCSHITVPIQPTQTPIPQQTEKAPVQDAVKLINEEASVINAVKKVSPAVVSIIISKDMPKIEGFIVNPFGPGYYGLGIPMYRQQGTEKREIGGGSGFIISKDGIVVTNRHVVEDDTAEYTVLLNDERRFTAKILARDFVNDMAVLKIEGTDLPTAEIGDSASLQVGQTVIAIGNALGEFRNTVSTGVISGLARTVVAGGLGTSEQLTDVIQTDASINPGNSGGPLLNLAGQVIGINTAVVQMAQNIGFAIPINSVKENITSVQQHGRIVRPWLGINYIPITKMQAQQYKLSKDYGLLIARPSPYDSAVIPNSPAAKAGLMENDIILEMDGTIIDEKTSLLRLIAKHKPNEVAKLRIWRNDQELELNVTLEEMQQ